MTAGDGLVRNPDGSLDFTFAPSVRIPMICILGADCDDYSLVPIPLPGSLTLSYGGRSTVVSALSVGYTLEGSDRSSPVPILSGTLDGAPVTVGFMRGSADWLDADFVTRVGDALGTTFSGGSIGALDFDFSSIGPVP